MTLRSVFARAVFIALFMGNGTAFASHHQDDAPPAMVDGDRAMTVAIEAEIVAVDLETKEVTLQGPQGNQITIVAQEQVVKLEDLRVGDRVAAHYLASLHGEVREPTAEELANPWLVLTEDAIDRAPEHPAVGAARQIRAVVTIDTIDLDAGLVVVKDSRGKLHTIGDIPRHKLEAIDLGAKAVVVYTEALAIGLEKLTSAAE